MQLTHKFETTWLQPLILKRDLLVSKVRFHRLTRSLKPPGFNP
jgi:hypothetical protein